MEIKSIKKYRKKNKKGIFFATLALLLISLFLLSFSIISSNSYRESIKKRVSTMNSFLASTEQDISRKLYIFGYRNILVWTEKTTTSGSFITDINASLNESFFDETFENNPHSFLSGTGYNSMIDLINEEANKINVNITFRNPKIQILQEDPWHVKITFLSDFEMNDLSNLASWEKKSSISALIPIKNFDDPIYIAKSNGFKSKFIKSNFSFPTNSLNLSLHLQNQYYTNNTDSPSFLMRFQGDLSSDPSGNGIESLVNLEKLQQQQGAPILDKSMVDHIYFSSSNPASSQVSGMPSWFKLDSSHLSSYVV